MEVLDHHGILGGLQGSLLEKLGTTVDISPATVTAGGEPAAKQLGAIGSQQADSITNLEGDEKNAPK